MADIKNFLKSRGFKDNELKEISKIWNAKNKENNLSKIYKHILSIKNSKSDLQKYRHYNSLIDLTNEESTYFLKSLVKAASYSEIGNQGLFYKNFEELLSINSSLYGIDLKQSYLSADSYEVYTEILKFLIAKIQENIRNDVLLKMFEINYRFLNTEKKSIKFVNESFEWSLNEIRELMKTHRYGYKFPAFWVNQLLGRTAVKEVNEYVQIFNNVDKIKYINTLDYWIFKNIYPTDDKSREILVNGLLSNKRDKPLVEFVILSLLDNPIFKKSISKKNRTYSKPVFSLLRKKLHENLHLGKESSLLVYKLLKMGEESNEFFWWLLL